ncbi:MAG: T9SS type B sorting domain-containing protein, partial [Chitinophagaceae bacterium]
TANTNNRVALQTPFAWDGTSNVVIEICFGTASTSATLSSTSPADVTSFTSVIKTHVAAATDAATVCGNTTTNVLTYTTRPKVIFEGQVITDITSTYTWTWNPGNLSGAQVVVPAPATAGVHAYTVLATNTTTGCTSLDTVSVTSGGTYTVAASSSPATICAGSSATLSATPGAAGLTYTYLWKDASNTVIGTSASLSVTPAATSTYTVTVTNNCGVIVTQPVTVTVNPIPVTTVSQLAQTLCSGATGSLSFSTQATGGSTVYTWTNSNPAIGLAASGTGAISFTASNSTATAQTATITVSAAYTNGGTTCTGPDATATITVNPTPSVNAVAGQTLCGGAATTAVTFSGAPAGVAYSWTNDNPSIGLAASGTGNIASFSAINNGTAPAVANISVTPQFTGGGQTCTGSAQNFSITVNPAATGTITAPNGTFICSGVTSVPLQVTGGTSYQWLLNGNPIAGATAATYNATQTGNYSVTITNAQGCTGTSSNTVAVTLVPAPQADFSFSGYCLNTPVQFSNLTANPSAVSFQWNFGNGQTSTLTAPTATYTQTGTYTVTLIAAPQGCPSITDTVRKTITIEAPIDGVRLAPVDVVSGRPTEIRGRNLANGHYNWTPATGLSNPAIWYPTTTLTQEQEYRIQVSFNSGCVTVDTLLVRVQKGDDIFVPTAFSPDGDGVNDVLRPITVGLTTFRSFRIFDRMGREIFATNSQAQGWDGTYRGQPLPSQTFVWVAEGRDSSGNIIRKTGQVLLVR